MKTRIDMKKLMAHMAFLKWARNSNFKLESAVHFGDSGGPGNNGICAYLQFLRPMVKLNVALENYITILNITIARWFYGSF